MPFNDSPSPEQLSCLAIEGQNEPLVALVSGQEDSIAGQNERRLVSTSIELCLLILPRNRSKTVWTSISTVHRSAVETWFKNDYFLLEVARPIIWAKSPSRSRPDRAGF